MLAVLGENPFDNPDWVYEIKLDGYRILASRHDGTRNLTSRNGHLYHDVYPSISTELDAIPHEFLIDGEVVVLDENGRSSFSQLQHLDREGRNRLFYYVFDLLWMDGYSLMNLPLHQRKELLKRVLPPGMRRIRYLDHIPTRGQEFFRQAQAMGLEGMIAKDRRSRYTPGKRSDRWIKVKTAKRQEVVIAGYTPPKGSRRYFGSLVMAVNEDGRLRYAGRVGSGFDERQLREIHATLERLKTDQAPVAVDEPTDVQWVRPELVAVVRFAEWTKTKSMRHPVFVSLRSDREPLTVVRETPQVRTRKLDARIGLSNPEKVFWSDGPIRKQDVYGYYEDLADVILPYLKDRPQSLYRTPDGAEGQGFFQKNVEGIAPEWVATVEVSHSSGSMTYLLCQDVRTLLFMVNLGCVEINPWSSSLPDIESPDYVVFDLDPVEVGFAEVVRVAAAFRDLFQEIGMPFYCKTSGSRGMHIYLPVIPKYSHRQAQQFVKLIETIIHRRFRALTSFERSPSNRKGKIYLDYLQNGRGRTMASVYSLRPRPGAKVSAPVAPGELTDRLDPADFTIATMRKRIDEHGDLWSGFFEHRVDIMEVITTLGG